MDRLRSRARRGFRGYPVATIAFYGPTNEFATKAAVSIIEAQDAEPKVLQRWQAGDVDIRRDRDVAAAIVAFLDTHEPRSIAMTKGIIGCPHEEGIDYPLGVACPHCPFWAGRDRWKDV